MPALAIPDPSLVVLVGPAGSGKSTLAARLFAPDEVLASDAMRAIVGRGESDQAATRAAFALLHRQLDGRLRDGRLTVVDATNVEAHARRSLLQSARAAGVPAVAILLDLPPDLVLRRNEARAGRVVDRGVVRHHLARLRAAVDRGLLEREGFDAVYRIREPAELDALRIEPRVGMR
ncbi:MAG: AAA family ATPase [Chloroflexota bacterium]